MSKFKVGHGAICVKETHEHNIGDVLLIKEIDNPLGLRFSRYKTYWNSDNFTPCPNPPIQHYKERIAHALGADIEFYHLMNEEWRKETKPSWWLASDYRVAIPDIHAEERESIKREIAQLQKKLDGLGGEL